MGATPKQCSIFIRSLIASAVFAPAMQSPILCRSDDVVRGIVESSAQYAEVPISTETASPAEDPKKPIPVSEAADNVKGDLDHSAFVPTGYRLVWHDEFDGDHLDMSQWSYRNEGNSSDGSGCSVLSREAVSLDGSGHLVLSTLEKRGELQTGMIGTAGNFEAVYGYFEARIQFQRHQGHHGAFWLKSGKYGAFPGDPSRSGVEIDIAEFFGSGRTDGGIGINVYWKGKGGETKRSTSKTKLPIEHVLASDQRTASGREEICEDFHLLSLLWTPSAYVFQIDGHEMFATKQGLSHRKQPIILSLLCHEWEEPKLDRTKLDDAMLVDYVRVYQRATDDVPSSADARTLRRTSARAKR